jgi:glycosyltransferase involved in cell wall biosynthesis
MTPLVSVVIPSYNHGRYIAAAVRSVLEQSLHDLELIVVDDGSHDDSLAVLAKFDDRRMRVVAQQNRGAHAAINAGLDLAQGEFLAILNSDDVYHRERLAALVSELRSDPRRGLAASHLEIIDAQGVVTGVKHGYRDLSPYALPHPERSFRAGDDLRHALTTENYLATTSNFVFTRELWRTLHEFRPLRYAHDWDFALRAARCSEIVLLPRPLLQYRIHGANTIRERGALLAFESCWCMVTHLPMILRDALSESPHVLQQMLHSLHHHDAGGMFVAALFAQLSGRSDAEREALAVQLLDPQHPLRRTHLEYLMQQFDERPMAPAVNPDNLMARARDLLRDGLSAVAYRLRRAVRTS